jgi:hypothetical protein
LGKRLPQVAGPQTRLDMGKSTPLQWARREVTSTDVVSP